MQLRQHEIRDLLIDLQKSEQETAIAQQTTMNTIQEYEYILAKSQAPVSEANVRNWECSRIQVIQTHHIPRRVSLVELRLEADWYSLKEVTQSRMQYEKSLQELVVVQINTDSI